VGAWGGRQLVAWLRPREFVAARGSIVGASHTGGLHGALLPRSVGWTGGSK
jgi:hypothetical protein